MIAKYMFVDFHEVVGEQVKPPQIGTATESRSPSVIGFSLLKPGRQPLQMI